MAVLNVQEEAVLEEICRRQGVPKAVVDQLLAIEEDLFGMGRRHGLYERIGEILEKAVSTQKG